MAFSKTPFGHGLSSFSSWRTSWPHEPGLGRLCVINVVAHNRQGAMEDELVILDGGMGDELRQKAPDQPW